MSLPIRFDSTEVGAPNLNNANGSWIGVLRAVLRDGFNVKAVTGITVAANVATVVCPAHGYGCGVAQLIRITGANAPALNGDKQPTLVDANTFTFPAPGVANGSYTATDARRAPLGWVEEFTDNNRSIFRRTAIEATAQMLYVNDSAANGASVTHARFWGVETATGLDSYTGKFPSEVQSSGGLYLQKGVNTAAAKPWAIVGDDRFIHITQEVSGLCVNCYFGDIRSYIPGDAYACVVNGGTNATAGSGAPSANALTAYTTASSTTGGYVARAPSALGGSLPAHQCGPNVTGGLGQGTVLSAPQNYIPIARPIHLMGVDSSVRHIRGEVPGLAAPLATIPFTHLQIVTSTDGEDAGRRYQAFSTNSGSIPGQFLIDLDGPWY